MAASYANTAVAVITNLIVIPVYVHNLSKNDYGLLLTVTSITGYLPLLNLGIARTTANRFAELRAADEPEQANRLLATGFWTYAAIVSVALVACMLAIPGLPMRQIFRGYADVGRVRAFLAVSVALLLLELPLTIFPACLRATGHIAQQQNLLSAQLVGRFAVSIAVLEWSGNITLIVALLGAVNILVDLVQLAWLRKVSAGVAFPPGLWDRRIARELRAPSAYYLLLDTAGVVVFGIDALVISSALGTAAVTSYVVAQRLVIMASGIPAEVAHSYGPRFIRAQGRGDPAGLDRDFATSFCLDLWIGAGLVLLLAALGPSFLQLWVGRGTYVGDATFRLLVAMLGLQVVLYPIDTLLVSLGRHKRYAIGSAVEAVLNLTLSLIFVRVYGVAGVALGTVVARLVTSAPVMMLEAARVLGRSFATTTRTAVTAVAPPILAGIAAALVASPIAPGIESLVIWGAVLGVIYVGASVALSRRSILGLFSETAAS